MALPLIHLLFQKGQGVGDGEPRIQQRRPLLRKKGELPAGRKGLSEKGNRRGCLLLLQMNEMEFPGKYFLRRLPARLRLQAVLYDGAVIAVGFVDKFLHSPLLVPGEMVDDRS